jgi:hypothetical protein
MVEAVPELMEGFEALLGKTGWTWAHVRESYEKLKMLPEDVIQGELMM